MNVPFKCENCDYELSAKEVIETDAKCPRCGDASVTAYSIDCANVINDMRDALIEAYKAIDSLPDDALGKVRPPDSFEEYAVKYELIHNIRKALKKAGSDDS